MSTPHDAGGVFLELEAPSRLVIHHPSQPRYVLTVLEALLAGRAP